MGLYSVTLYHTIAEIQEKCQACQNAEKRVSSSPSVSEVVVVEVWGLGVIPCALPTITQSQLYRKKDKVMFFLTTVCTHHVQHSHRPPGH